MRYSNRCFSPIDGAEGAVAASIEKPHISGAAMALLSAFAYGGSIPFIKLFGADVSYAAGSALLYLGCGLCMVLVRGLDAVRGRKPNRGARLSAHDIPLLAAMIGLNAASAVALLAGIALTDAATASLLGNFEVAATALFAWIIFHERMGRNMWAAVAVIVAASILLSWDSSQAATFAPGALLVLAACVLWGLENNATRALSSRDVVSVTMVKGFGTAVLCALIALSVGGVGFALASGLCMVLVGFVSYGLSIMLYITAQRFIGAARTGNYFAVAPFVGVIASWVLFGIAPSITFVPAFILSLVGVALTALDEPRGQ